MIKELWEFMDGEGGKQRRIEAGNQGLQQAAAQRMTIITA